MNKERNRIAGGKGLGKFLLCSFLGIFIFFIQIDIGGNSRIPADHLIALLKAGVSGWYPYIIFALAGYSVIRRIAGRKSLRSPEEWFFFVQTLLGLLLCGLVILGLLPQVFLDIARSAITATGNILCAIFLTSLFIPFLTEYGLVDFVGVLCEPLMRRVFLTPGSSAVIGVSAFLGNYSMGHVISKQMYDEGRFTETEAVIVAVGFSTCSIGLMINLLNYMDMMVHWNLYVVSVLIVTFGTTIITARIPPIRWKKEEYKPGTAPQTEAVETEKLLHRALRVGVEKAQCAPALYQSVKEILGRVFPIICEITGTSIFIIPVGMFLVEYTNVFSVIGAPFYPLLRLVGITGADAMSCARSLGVSVLEPVLAGVISNGTIASPVAKWIVSIVPYSGIVFLAGFIPSLWKSGINCRLSEMLAIWLERVAIGIVLSALLAYLFVLWGLL